MDKAMQDKKIGVDSLSKVNGNFPPFSVQVVFAILVMMGVVTGFILARSSSGFKPGFVLTGSPKVKTAGVDDAKTFKDSAVGKIEKGGVDGEGTHKLIREGGPSQTAFLISSIVDLDEFVGQEVKVWGETFAAQKAAWLMDVGRIEVVK